MNKKIKNNKTNDKEMRGIKRWNFKNHRRKKMFNREFEAYMGGFYDDYSYLDEHNNGSKCDLMIEAYLIGIDITGRLKQSDIHKIKRYNRDK